MKYAFAAAALVSAVIAAPGAPPAYGSTVEVTTEVTVTSCAAYVTDCPASEPYASVSVPAATSVPVVYASVSSAVVEPSAPAGYPSGGWGAPPPEESAPAYPPPEETSPGWGAPPPAPTGGWGAPPPAPYPSAPPAPTPTGAYPTGTGVAYPTPTGYAPVPATGAGSSVQTTGFLAAAGALLAFFL